MNKIEAIIFDLGGVLIDWNPKYLYREVFDGDEKKVNWFLSTICTSKWNVEHDAGRPLHAGTELLVTQYPEYEAWIRIYYDRWSEMLGGPISGTVALLDRLKKKKEHRLYALTNWSAETFPIALKRFEFLEQFEGIVVSGEEMTRKPFTKIYEILLERYKISPDSAIFIDDNDENVKSAINLGIKGIRFENANQLQSELSLYGVYTD